MDIRKLREEKGLSQRKLASKVGVSVTTVINWEYNTSEPNEENMNKLKEVLEGGE